MKLVYCFLHSLKHLAWSALTKWKISLKAANCFPRKLTVASMPVPQLRNARKQRSLSSSTAVARNAKVYMVLHVNQKEFYSVKMSTVQSSQ